VNHTTQVRTVEAWDKEGGLGPPGAVWLENEQAWNFTLYSRHATGVTLLLYGATDFIEPLFQLQFNPLKNKTARVWHCLVPQQLGPAARYYAYRVQGPWNPPAGQRFDADKVLFDPYAEELFFHRSFRAKRRGSRVATTAVRFWEYYRAPSSRSIGAEHRRCDIRTTQLSMSYMSKDSPRERILRCLTINAAHFWG